MVAKMTKSPMPKFGKQMPMKAPKAAMAVAVKGKMPKMPAKPFGKK